MKLGYIGLGALGRLLAQRLMTTYELRVLDIDSVALAHLESLGGIPEKNAASMARNCDVIMLCVPRSSDVREIIFGVNGLIEGLSAGKIIIDQTTGDPRQTRDMSSALEKIGVAMVDAPVSGLSKVMSGASLIMVGASASTYKKVQPVLTALSSNVVHCGDVGSGLVLKIINNTISTVIRLATLECVAMGLRNGLDLSVMAGALNKGGARSVTTEVQLPALVRGEQASNFALQLMLKDLNLSTQLAIDSGAPMLYGHLTRCILQSALFELGPQANIDEIAHILAAQAGVSFPRRTSAD